MRDSNRLVRQVVFALLLAASGIACAWANSAISSDSFAYRLASLKGECGEWGYPPTDLNHDCWVNLEEPGHFRFKLAVLFYSVQR